ncbi:hypothetical protein BU251_02350 [Candidatus Velamenicoccus archaeovorus]|uniref:DUF2062 domain-containing protein n=1 Tax=Velamenicoccus archaeovorus TaxID=1930593 RepID=A0A410P3E7_VELA1|nr:DUF2062 domain-containing protein [Candidatus Velamenicoccus archaeovorus]QAT16650.1 hypothetical protein BU251_02350 [Candidatus Velamenicoccus archaeovorus]
MSKRSIKDMVSALAKVLKEHHAPHEVALGVAIGAFIAVLPLYGFHTLLCVIAAVLVPRANKLAILLGTNISLPPTIATITWTSYDIGRLILAHKRYPPLSWEYVRNFSISRFNEFYYPLFTGSLVLGLICAVVFYVITWAVASRMGRKHSLGK